MDKRATSDDSPAGGVSRLTLLGGLHGHQYGYHDHSNQLEAGRLLGDGSNVAVAAREVEPIEDVLRPEVGYLIAEDCLYTGLDWVGGSHVLTAH